MLPACGPDATPLTIEPMPGPSRPGVVRMSFWMTCEIGTVLFDTSTPWQLAFGFAEPPLPATAGPAVKTSVAAPTTMRRKTRFTASPFAAEWRSEPTNLVPYETITGRGTSYSFRQSLLVALSRSSSKATGKPTCRFFEDNGRSPSFLSRVKVTRMSAAPPGHGDALHDRLPAAVGRLRDLDRFENLRRDSSLLLHRNVVPRVRLRQVIERLNVGH